MVRNARVARFSGHIGDQFAVGSIEFMFDLFDINVLELSVDDIAIVFGTDFSETVLVMMPLPPALPSSTIQADCRTRRWLMWSRRPRYRPS